MAVQGALQIDQNFNPVQGNEAFLTTKSFAYDGTIGAQGAATVFTVTGPVLVSVFAVCTEDLAGATATIELGISGNTAALIAQTTATDIDNNEVWIDNAPATIEAVPSTRIIGNGQDIIETIATADITDGTLTYYCLWRPLSSTASVVAA